MDSMLVPSNTHSLHHDMNKNKYTFTQNVEIIYIFVTYSVFYYEFRFIIVYDTELCMMYNMLLPIE